MTLQLPTSVPQPHIITLCVDVAFDAHRLLKMGIYIDTPVFLWFHKCAEKDLAMTKAREIVWLTLLSVSSWCVIMSYWLVKSRAAELIATQSVGTHSIVKCWPGVSHDLDHEPWECVALAMCVPGDTKPKTLLGQYYLDLWGQGDKWASHKLHKIMGMLCNTYRWNHTRNNPHCCMNPMQKLISRTPQNPHKQAQNT